MIDRNPTTLKSIKGKVFSDQLAEFPYDEVKGEDIQFPDEHLICTTMEENKWQLFFDGAANKHGYGIGMLLVDPKDIYTPIAIRLEFEATNNIAEYEACIAGLEAALERNVTSLEVFGDSLLIINQTSGKWKIQDSTLQRYCQRLEELIEQFQEITFNYLPRDKNRFADALATITSLVEMPEGKMVKPFKISRRNSPAYCMSIEINEIKASPPWYKDIMNFL